MNYKHFLAAIMAGCALASTSLYAFTELQPPAEYKKVSKQLVDILEGIHYNKTTVDDRISALAFDEYIDSLDPTKSFFLAADIEKLEQYRFQFDDAIRSGDTSIAYDIYNYINNELKHGSIK